MNLRGLLLGVVALGVTAAIGGCASSVGGTGSLGVVGTGLPTGVPTSLPSGFPTSLPSGFPTSLPSGFPTSLPSGLPTSLPTGVPSGIPTDIPSGLPTSLPSGVPTAIPPIGHSRICPLLSPAERNRIFGASDVTATSISTGCTFGSASAGISIIIDSFSSLTAAADKQEHGGTDISIAGHPGVQLDGGDVVVSLGSSLQARGELYAFNATPAGVPVAKKLLTAVLPKLPH